MKRRRQKAPGSCLRVAPLLCGLLLLCPPVLGEELYGPEGAGEGDELEDEFALLEEAAVVESAARHKQEIGMSPSAITVITREDIATSGATTIPDLLRLVPGMDVIVTSALFAQVTSRLYWTNEGQHYLVLVDGREANVELMGFPVWASLPIFLEDIERIEVIRGPGSSLYGANALAGVISITTRGVPKEDSGWVRVSGGEVGAFSAGARATTRTGDWGFSLSGGVDYSGGFSDHRVTGRNSWMVRSVVEYRLSESKRLLLDGGLSYTEGPLTTSMGALDGYTSFRTLRLAYQSDDLRGHLYWMQHPLEYETKSALEYAGILLARPMTWPVDTHSVDGEVQWNLPRFWEPLLLIVGGGGRAAWLDSENSLDAETFTDMTSPRYHELGAQHTEARASAFVHAELAPADWVTVTGGARFDYNTVTDPFISPRLAAVFRPAPGQFIRLGVARSFRKPSYLETGAHMGVVFPEGSPIQGPAQDKFMEFMTRVLGNSDLDNEELLSFEAGYLGRFLDGKLVLGLDLFCNLHTNLIFLDSNIQVTEQGLPDLNTSSFMNENMPIYDMDIIGGELTVRYSPSRNVSLFAAWAHRQVFFRETGKSSDENPKNLITLGARFRAEWGLLGSLYAFSRSEFWDRNVGNPAGLLEPLLFDHMENVVLVLAKLGWTLAASGGVELEAGAKLFLPISPFSPPYFRYREKGGGVTAMGQDYGGDHFRRVITGYLQGTF